MSMLFLLKVYNLNQSLSKHLTNTMEDVLLLKHVQVKQDLKEKEKKKTKKLFQIKVLKR